MKKLHSVIKVFSILLSVLLVFPASLISAATAPVSTAKVEHKAPGEKYIPGFRINLAAEITDAAGLLATRCYFKTKNDKNFAFVDMTSSGGANYQATLPAPFVNSEEVNYLFVVVNKNKQVNRTQIFTIEEGETKEAKTWKDMNEVKEVRLDKAQDVAEQYVALYNKEKGNYTNSLPSYQTTAMDMALTVNTELSRDLVPLNGFYDSATVSEVAASEKYGFLAENLYSADAIAANGGTAAIGSATTGTVAASTGGLSTPALVGIGALVAIGAGIAIASSSGGSDGSSGGGTSLTAANIVGAWDYSGTRNDGVARVGTTTFNAGGAVDYSIDDADNQSDGSGTGSWTLAGTTLTMTSVLSSDWTGTVSGTDTAFTFTSNHGTYSFTR